MAGRPLSPSMKGASGITCLGFALEHDSVCFAVCFWVGSVLLRYGVRRFTRPSEEESIILAANEQHQGINCMHAWTGKNGTLLR